MELTKRQTIKAKAQKKINKLINKFVKYDRRLKKLWQLCDPKCISINKRRHRKKSKLKPKR